MRNKEILKFKIEKEIIKLGKSVIDDAFSIVDPGLYTGVGGYFLFLFQNYKHTGDNRYLEILNESVRQSLTGIEKTVNLNLSFASGVTGWGWAIQYLSEKKILEYDVEPILSDVDDIVRFGLKKNLSNDNLDCFYGAIGAGNYFFRRNKPEENLEIVNYLNEKKCNVNGGLAWKKVNDNKDQYDFSLSHGISGIIHFLTKCIKANICPELSLELLKGATNFLMQNIQISNQHYSFFPGIVESDSYDLKNRRFFRTRLAWCYGDLSIFYVLLETALLLSDEQLKSLTVSSLLEVAKRKSFEDTLILDPGFCHGSIGCAYLFHKIWLKTQNKAFLDISEYWLNISVNFNSTFPGVEGYSYLSGSFENRKFKKSNELLEGNIALSLVYLSYVNKSLCNDWDEALMLN